MEEGTEKNKKTSSLAKIPAITDFILSPIGKRKHI